MSGGTPDRVLAVCTGNICRSPFAERYLRRLAAVGGVELRASSAGTHACPGTRATPEARLAASEFGVDLDGHRARSLLLQDLEDASLVLAMTPSHARLLEPMFLSMPPDLRPRIEVFDVPDPFGRGLERYRDCYAKLASLLDRWFEERFPPPEGGKRGP